MDDHDLREALRRVGHGDRSFGVLRTEIHQRPLASSEQIADRLEEEIAREILPPGTHLRETDLAQRFQVSRGPIRDALRLLDGDGLIRLSPNRGAVVTDYSAVEMRQIANVSSPLTKLVLSRVLRSISSETMEEMLLAQDRIGDLLARNDAVAFALALATLTIAQSSYATGQIGARILQLLYRPSIRYTIAGLQRPEAIAPAIDEWKVLREATNARDPERSSAAFVNLLRNIHIPVIRMNDRASHTAHP